MKIATVSTFERPDLVALTARLRWEAFYQEEGRPLDDVLRAAQWTAAEDRLIPRTWVLLAEDEPVGTASLTAHDLDERPELTPWFAGLYVVPHARRRGHGARLIAAVEAEAQAAAIRTLWLYTNSGEQLYVRVGWRATETIQHGPERYVIMRRDLLP